jgi:hypothetical protein
VQWGQLFFACEAGLVAPANLGASLSFFVCHVSNTHHISAALLALTGQDGRSRCGPRTRRTRRTRISKLKTHAFFGSAESGERSHMHPATSPAPCTILEEHARVTCKPLTSPRECFIRPMQHLASFLNGMTLFAHANLWHMPM